MKPLISSQSEKNILKYAAILDRAGIKYERCMDFPHHPNDHLLKVAELDYSRGMNAIYPNRNTPNTYYEA
jgi:hypothetical protein